MVCFENRPWKQTWNTLGEADSLIPHHHHVWWWNSFYRTPAGPGPFWWPMNGKQSHSRGGGWEVPKGILIPNCMWLVKELQKTKENAMYAVRKPRNNILKLPFYTANLQNTNDIVQKSTSGRTDAWNLICGDEMLLRGPVGKPHPK